MEEQRVLQWSWPGVTIQRFPSALFHHEAPWQRGDGRAASYHCMFNPKPQTHRIRLALDGGRQHWRRDLLQNHKCPTGVLEHLLK